MTPLVSIGIPTYNKAHLLGQAIQSVLQQSFQDFEIIISDDCSTDSTAEVVAHFRDARVRYHRTATNLRPPRNWNECVRLAQGDFFALLPDDDVYCPSFLANLLTQLQAYPHLGFAQCGYYNVDSALRLIRTVKIDTASLALTGEAALIWQMERLQCIPASLLFRRAAMLQLGLWREDFWDDWSFIVRMAFRFGFIYRPEVLAANRIHTQNLNRVLHREGRDPILDLMNQQAAVFGEALPLTPALCALRARLQRELSYHCVLMTLGSLKRRQWQIAHFHWTRARQLDALSGFDLGWLKMWLNLRTQARLAQQQLAQAQTQVPMIHLPH